MSGIGAAVLVAALVLTGAAAWWLRARDGVVREVAATVPESHLDEVRELDVRRTPTLFFLGRDGAVIGRSSGAPRPEDLTALVDAHVGSSR